MSLIADLLAELREPVTPCVRCSATGQVYRVRPNSSMPDGLPVPVGTVLCPVCQGSRVTGGGLTQAGHDLAMALLDLLRDDLDEHYAARYHDHEVS